LNNIFTLFPYALSPAMQEGTLATSITVCTCRRSNNIFSQSHHC